MVVGVWSPKKRAAEREILAEHLVQGECIRVQALRSVFCKAFREQVRRFSDVQALQKTTIKGNEEWGAANAGRVEEYGKFLAECVWPGKR